VARTAAGRVERGQAVERELSAQQQEAGGEGQEGDRRAFARAGQQHQGHGQPPEPGQQGPAWPAPVDDQSKDQPARRPAQVEQGQDQKGEGRRQAARHQQGRQPVEQQVQGQGRQGVADPQARGDRPAAPAEQGLAGVAGLVVGPVGTSRRQHPIEQRRDDQRGQAADQEDRPPVLQRHGRASDKAGHRPAQRHAAGDQGHHGRLAGRAGALGRQGDQHRHGPAQAQAGQEPHGQ
jgi:hypothetical protein